MKPDRDPYLWDRSGDPDPELIGWERRLSAFGARLEDLIELPLLKPSKGKPFLKVFVQWVVAASFVLVAALVSLRMVWQPGQSWKVTAVSGAPVGNGKPLGTADRLPLGTLLTTDNSSRIHLRLGLMAKIDIEPGTTVRFSEERSKRQRLFLQSGKITARVWAPPFSLFVNTPAATAIDLGCAFSLQVTETGEEELRVTSGWVASERGNRQAVIPAGAMVWIRPPVGPGTPFFEDASARLKSALAELDFEDSGYNNVAALSAVISEARQRDAISLLGLLRRVKPAQRGLVFDRLSTLLPPPSGLTREDVVHGRNERGVDEWWRKLGLGEAKSWFLNWRDVIGS